MKDFLGVFLICYIVCVIATFFFGSFILSNIWGSFIVVALILAMIITGFINQDTRIDELEKKMAQLMQEKQN